MSDQYSSSDSIPTQARRNYFGFDASDGAADMTAQAAQMGLDEAESSDEILPLRDPASLNAAPTIRSGPTRGPSPSTINTSHASTGSLPSATSSHHSSYSSAIPRDGNTAGLNSISTAFDSAPPPPPTPSGTRSHRPTATRTPSSAYAPPRKPSQFTTPTIGQRSSSKTRSRLNPDADYRAQKKLYVQRLQQDNPDEDMGFSPSEYPPSLGYSEGSETEDDQSPSTADYADSDAYDQDNTMLLIGNDEAQPSVEELKIPENRERIEWHSMLASVLTGDVVKQEKRRLIGAADQPADEIMRAELWTGIRARVCGRTVPAQKRMVDGQRSKIVTMIEEVVTFEIKGETEVGKDAREQVEGVVRNIEKIESLYSSTKKLELAHPRAASDDYRQTCEALVSWHNTTAMINTELGILQAWVGNEELDFVKSRQRPLSEGNLTDDSSFVERILKEDGLKSLTGKTSMLIPVVSVIDKAKQTLIRHAALFSERHLPPYIEELLTLINFPSRLLQEIIRMRLQYSKKIKDPAQHGVMMAEQMISQFQILLQLAVDIKNSYDRISQPEPGWDLPPCMDENFDSVVLNALKFYFKMLNWKLSANKNTFKEAEILEQEWDFSSKLGIHVQGGDVEVAEQFSTLTSRSLTRLTTHFERELQRRPNEVAGPEMDRRYKQILDSVRVRQRKLFRFSRILSQTFENAMEYALPMDLTDLQQLYDILVETGHTLVNNTSGEKDNLAIIASPSLQDRPRDITALILTAYHAEGSDPTFPYVLVICTDCQVTWEGPVMDVDMSYPPLDMKPGKMRLIAEGAQTLLINTRDNFEHITGMHLEPSVEKRANIGSVDRELQRVRKTTYKLSNTIMGSVEIIRKQLAGLDCHELIQTCFAFATEFGQRSFMYLDYNRRAMNNIKLTRLALDWVSFICDDCVASERKTFRWAVVALEFAMVMTRGQNILSLSDEEYEVLRGKVSGCMSLLISHFDIMGARSTVAAQAEKQRTLEQMSNAPGGKFKLDISKLKDDEESSRMVRQQWLEHLAEIDEQRVEKSASIKPLGRVLESSTEADRSLTFLSASATNVTVRWQQGQYIGGGAFGSVYVATDLDSGHLLAVKEIRLHDPSSTPSLITNIGREMSVLQALSHPNIVEYHGIEVHRDKVYIFMEYCAGGSLAQLLEHGRIEDETVITVYALQMLEGLAYLHEMGVIHRDIKPENILLDHNGVLKYVDFGAAKVVAHQSGKTLARGPGNDENVQKGDKVGGQRGAKQKSMTGTPMYMSPEVIRGTGSLPGNSPSSPSSPAAQARPGAADTWSLGCVILEMATGRRPWATLDNEWAIMYNIAQGNAPALPTPDQLSEQGIDFLKRCFERDPSKRASAAELLQHAWIMELRGQLNLEPVPLTPGSSEGSREASRQSTREF